MHIARNIFVVVPCYNESGVVAETVNALLHHGYSVVVVDDGSVNNCKGYLMHMPVYYLRHALNLGQGAAIQTGIDFALKKDADSLVTFDADGQHDAKDIGLMLDYLQQNELDFVFGSRFLKGAATNVHPLRKILLHVSRFTNFFISGILLSDSNNGLRVFTAAAAKRIRIRENRRTHSSDIIYQVKRSGIRYGEFPVNVGYSEYSRKKGIQNTEGITIFMKMLLYKFLK